MFSVQFNSIHKIESFCPEFEKLLDDFQDFRTEKQSNEFWAV